MPIACVTRPSACHTAHDSTSATDKPGDSPERCPGPGSVSAGGRTILPGLIDAHAHISDTAAATVALMSGVTTARSAGVPMFADVALREMVKSGYLAGPDILAAGVHLQPRFENPSDILSDPR